MRRVYVRGISLRPEDARRLGVAVVDYVVDMTYLISRALQEIKSTGIEYTRSMILRLL